MMKNKIIKWLGGYTEEEVAERQKIARRRTELVRLSMKLEMLNSFKGTVSLLLVRLGDGKRVHNNLKNVQTDLITEILNAENERDLV